MNNVKSPASPTDPNRHGRATAQPLVEEHIVQWAVDEEAASKRVCWQAPRQHPGQQLPHPHVRRADHDATGLAIRKELGEA